MTIRIGTRGSDLALWQAKWVAKQLQFKDIITDIIIIETKGDRMLDVSMSKIGSKGVFTQELEEELLNDPKERAEHVMSLVRQASGGRDYDNRFGVRQTGRGAYADMLGARFRTACKRFGLTRGRYQQGLDCSLFEPPGQRQLGLGL